MIPWATLNNEELPVAAGAQPIRMRAKLSASFPVRENFTPPHCVAFLSFTMTFSGIMRFSFLSQFSC